MLIGARVLQGAGAALMNPATLSIIAATFPPRSGDGDRHLGRTSALALAIGPLVGGLITEHVELELDLLHQRPDRDPRDRRELPLHRRVADETHAVSTARARHVRARALRAHVRR
jgi:hypothetical protein